MKDKRILTLFLTIFIDLLGFGIIIPILPVVTKKMALQSGLHLDADVAVGLTMGVFSLMQFLFSPIWGSLSDKVGRRPIILGSILATAVGYVMLGISNTFIILFLARLVAGIGSANISAAQAYIADITPPQERAKKMGLIGAAFGLGFVFGPPIGGALYAAGGLMWVGFATAGLCIFNFIMAWFTLPESLTQKNTERRSFISSFTGLRHVWKEEILGELFIINVIYIAAFSMMQVNASVLWSEHYHLTEKQVGYMFGFIGVCSAVVQGGLIGTIQKVVGLQRMLLFGCPIVAVGLSVIPLPSQEWFVPVQICAVICLAIGNGMLMPAINSLVSANTPAHDQGKTLGLLQSTGSLARSVGPVVSGFFYSMWFMLPYLSAGCLMLLALLLALKLTRKLSPGSGQ
ncbi:MAG: MFS transporter [Sphingomonadales bacterium]|jgi:DHA1 family tetracycline resistance protein-like MFS transporter